MNPGTSHRVLVVDDHEGMRALCAVMLHRLGYEPVTAATAGAALEQAGSSHYDLVLSDQEMPGGDGLGLLRRLRARGEPMPFVLMSTDIEEAVVRAAYGAGAALVVDKTRVIEALPQVLERALGRRALPEPLAA
jgi:two-component system chemotaxis response regulator CheY